MLGSSFIPLRYLAIRCLGATFTNKYAQSVSSFPFSALNMKEKKDFVLHFIFLCYMK